LYALYKNETKYIIVLKGVLDPGSRMLPGNLYSWTLNSLQ